MPEQLTDPVWPHDVHVMHITTVTVSLSVTDQTRVRDPRDAIWSVEWTGQFGIKSPVYIGSG
jgi:hypothetical protein